MLLNVFASLRFVEDTALVDSKLAGRESDGLFQIRTDFNLFQFLAVLTKQVVPFVNRFERPNVAIVLSPAFCWDRPQPAKRGAVADDSERNRC